MSFDKALETLGFSPDEIAKIQTWISTTSMGSKVPAEKIGEKFLGRAKESVDAGLRNELQAGFIGYVMSCTLSDITFLIPPPPGIALEYMPFGYYPTRTRKGKGGSGNELTSSIVGFGNLEKKGEWAVTQMDGFGEEMVMKRNCLKPFNIYDTVISFDPKKRKGISIHGYMHKEDTKFDGNIINPENVPQSIEDRYRLALSQFPLVTLLDASNPNNLSRLLQSDKAGGLKSKPFPDNLDIKVVQVSIADVKFGKGDSEKGGREWAQFSVTDSTFIPTQERKTFNVWVDPQLVRVIGCGKGSYVKLFGTLQKDQKGVHTEMSCCAIIPIKLAPLVESPADLSGTPTGTPSANTMVAADRVVSMSL